jgi:peptidoglycan/xylan/chitin deacetylase (PgdA/CDA1 family)
MTLEAMSMGVACCTWKHGKRWVYSITYDEALADLSRFVVPAHEEFGFPGHVEVVAGQIGEVRKVGRSSYNGFRHMKAAELRDLVARGWGVGNHSWSHERVEDDLERELEHAKDAIEDAVEKPVTIYCAPGNNDNMVPPILDACRRYGYLAAMSVTDGINLPADELFWLNRCTIHHEMPAPWFAQFDPWRRIRQAQEAGGWVIDYCHCPLEEPVHVSKDVSYHEHRQRFEAVRTEGADAWFAIPEDVIDYHLVRRSAKAETVQEDALCLRYRVSSERVPEAVACREVTLDIDLPEGFAAPAAVTVDGGRIEPEWSDERRVRITVDVTQPVDVEVRPMSGE